MTSWLSNSLEFQTLAPERYKCCTKLLSWTKLKLLSLRGWSKVCMHACKS